MSSPMHLQQDEPLWTTHEGRVVRPADMNDFHLRNAIQKLGDELSKKQRLYRALEAELNRRNDAALATISITPTSSI